MIHIALPDSSQKRLVFYLAMEEYLAKHISDFPLGEYGVREVFFIWQVPPTVIFGRNQVMEAEVNIAYCKENGVQMYRRKSGGGCVYADMGNIMLSYISDSTDVAFTFDKFLQRLALILRKIGLKAERSGRNDILVEGRKVSGNAFFLLPKASIVHGTLLFDSDFDALQKAITPSEAKILSKGVDSVRQHVVNVKEVIESSAFDNMKKTADIEVFKKYLISSFVSGSENGCEAFNEIVLQEAQIKAIEEIEASYLDPVFLYGKNHSYSIENKANIEGVGEIRPAFEMLAGKIEACRVYGDFFPLKSGLDERLSAILKGLPYEEEALRAALKDFPIEEYIMNLSNEAFMESLFKNSPK